MNCRCSVSISLRHSIILCALFIFMTNNKWERNSRWIESCVLWMQEYSGDMLYFFPLLIATVKIFFYLLVIICTVFHHPFIFFFVTLCNVHPNCQNRHFCAYSHMMRERPNWINCFLMMQFDWTSVPHCWKGRFVYILRKCARWMQCGWSLSSQLFEWSK